MDPDPGGPKTGGSGSATLIERKLRLRRGRESAMVSHPRKTHRLFFLYFTDCRLDQREGMGVLEYQALPSLRDVAHEGVLCTFSNRSAPDRGKWCGPSGPAAWTVHHVQNHTLLARSPSASQAGRCVGPAPLVFGLT